MRYTLDKAYVKAIEHFGLSLTEILREARLPEDLLNRNHASLTATEYFRFAEAIGHSLLPEDIIRLATAERVETFSPPIFAAYCSSDMAHCVERMARYKQLIGPLRLSARQSETDYTIILSAAEEVEIPEQVVQMEFIFMVHLFAKATRSRMRPTAVTVRREPSTSTLRDFFDLEP